MYSQLFLNNPYIKFTEALTASELKKVKVYNHHQHELIISYSHRLLDLLKKSFDHKWDRVCVCVCVILNDDCNNRPILLLKSTHLYV